MLNFFKEVNISETRENNLKLIFGLGSIVYAAFGILLHTSEMEYNDPIWLRLAIVFIGIVSLGLSLYSNLVKKNIVTVLFANLYIYNAHLYYLLFTNDFDANYKLSLLVVIVASILFIQDKKVNAAYLIVNMVTYLTILFVTNHFEFENLSVAFLIFMALFIGYLTNSERIDAFNQIKSRETLLKSINNNVYHGIFRLDPDDKIIYANDNFARILGYSSVEELSKIPNPLELKGKDKRQLLESIKSSRRFLKNEEVELVRQDGNVFWVLLSLTPFFNEQGSLIYYDGAIIDITERKFVEEELMLFSAAIDHSTTSVTITDNKGRIKYVNPFFTRTTGYNFDEIIGNRIQDYIIRDNPTAGEMWNQLSQGKIWKGELDHYNKSGNLITELTSIAPIRDGKGKVINFVVVSEDITERKKAEKELLKAKEQAEAATKAQEQFLSTVSHELRTPMNAVIGITNLLLEESPQKEQIENLKILKFSANNLLVLINDILDLSKIEAGKMDFVSQDFNLSGIIDKIKNAHSIRAGKKGISLFAEIEGNVPQMLVGDMYRLNQILNNLVSNAIKFTDTGGVFIGVSIKKERDNSAELEFCIRDTGIGIQENKLEQIFDSFSQASSLTNRIYGGTGLGLAITKRLIELQGGTINVKSRVNEGSEFTFSLKFEKSSKFFVEKELPAINYTGLSGIKILLVEDNKVNQKVACKFLEKWDAKVEVCDNGQEALSKFKISDYDIILMDIQMPVMDGYEATTQIRKMEKGKDIPVIALSASAMKHEREKAFEAGVDDYVTKPFVPSELYSKIARFAYKEVRQEE